MTGDLTDSDPGRLPDGRTPRGIRNRSWTGVCIATAAIAVLVAGAVGPALAADTFSPFGRVEYEHDSNVFMRPSSAPPFAAQGITAFSDTLQNYEAGMEAEVDSGPDRLTLDAEGTRHHYDRFSFLNHYEYRLGADLHWRLGPVVDGVATYRQTRYMAPFTQTFGTSLLLDTERTANVTVRVLMTPEWRLDLTPELDQLDTPLPGFPDFRLHETVDTIGLDFLGFGKLTCGVQFIYSSGRYEAIADATRYQQREADFTASYKVSQLSTFTANVGYTSRNTEANPADTVASPTGTGDFAGVAGGIGKTSGVTGALSYRRQLTGKTGAMLTLFRRVESYAAGANPMVGTGGEFGLTWQADPKISLRLGYGLERDQIEGGLVVVDAAGRTDRTQTAEFELRYAALSWLTIRPYADWARASSTLKLANYSATTVGIDITARLH